MTPFQVSSLPSSSSYPLDARKTTHASLRCMVSKSNRSNYHPSNIVCHLTSAEGCGKHQIYDMLPFTSTTSFINPLSHMIYKHEFFTHIANIKVTGLLSWYYTSTFRKNLLTRQLI